jgi:hypothetical protein
METKYGQIAESRNINKAIYDCFDYLSEKDQKKYVKKFIEIPHDQTQVMHTFRELLLGTYLSANGLIVESEKEICGKNPDWSILDTSFNLFAIVENVSHHLDRANEDDIHAQREAGKVAIGYRPNRNDPEHLRLYSKIQEKASAYKEIVSEINIPYVVAVFIDLFPVIDVQEVIDCLMSGEESLFELYPDLSGLIYFKESNMGSYHFEFIDNPYGLRKIDIPSGYLFRS